MIEFLEEDLFKVIRRLMGWPELMSHCGVSLAKIWAVAHWAFKKSDYWPERLGSLDDFITSFSKLVEQYDKYYARLPENEKPHELGVGRPEREVAEND